MRRWLCNQRILYSIENTGILSWLDLENLTCRSDFCCCMKAVSSNKVGLPAKCKQRDYFVTTSNTFVMYMMHWIYDTDLRLLNYTNSRHVAFGGKHFKQVWRWLTDWLIFNKTGIRRTCKIVKLRSEMEVQYKNTNILQETNTSYIYRKRQRGTNDFLNIKY